ncbi:PAS domain S-box-containing protein/diguanylate cyclase (GGDEF) domain-containing protein [Clostridium amylolyticum]|uniref:PAS domain S-box-containing protein/diguanylate cyclase (GGDEF) domain-containing protein n=1 Tax=Clostridium amylolyticum TaxID=1121298 RepID=A0A1M6C307_9CLOT|nr:PAS domain S-box protein [Clostridium amylolyticum]SHI55088.1 PAS domain S-box-containing protein/diguanylate cyclase (GGDEF) domain-containing protein [Clostridium amylolyticum]
MKDNFYKQLVEKLPTGYAYHRIICDKNNIPYDYVFLETNAAFEKFTGLKAAQVIGKRISEILPNTNIKEFNWIKVYGEIALTGREKQFEQYSQELKRWYRVKVYSPEKNYFVTIFIDITKEMRSLEEKTTILTTLNDIVFEIDKDYRFINIISSDDNYLFIAREDIIGKSIKELFSKDLSEIFISSFQKALASGKKESIIYKSPLRNDNNWYNADIKYAQISNKKKYIVSVSDISEQKKLEYELFKKTQELEKYHLIFEHSPLGIYHFDSQGIITDCNDSFVKIIGSSRDELIGLDTLKLSDKKVVKAIQGVLKSQQTSYEGDYKSITGHKVTSVKVMFAPILSLDKEIEGGIGIVEDITQRKHMEKIIFEEKERLKTTLLSIGDGVISTDNHGNVLFLNKVAEQLTGWAQEEAFGRSLEEVFHTISEFTREKCENPVFNVLETGNIIELANDTILISKDRTQRHIEDSAAPIMDKNSNINGVVLVFRDVTEEKERQAKIQYLSFHDQLTGLNNRRFFEDELRRIDTTSNLPITLVMIDVNGLKLTNDAFGHLLGDKLLQRVAEILRKECRNEDIIARIGGDEFVILLPKTSSEEAERFLNRINAVITQEKINSMSVSVSYGWETKRETEEDLSSIFKKAEDYMYRRKLSESTSMRYKTIEVIIKTLYEKNEREEKHSIRVSELCTQIALALDLNTININELRTVGLMHDIGKIAIDDKILDKSGTLSDSEWLEVKRHPEIGYRILSSLNEYAPLAEYVLAHHERWDGKGYPKGLKGEDIPWQSRIIAVADAYDAMTSHRPYRQALSRGTAIEIIKTNAGTYFDPKITKVFVEKVLEEKW